MSVELNKQMLMQLSATFVMQLAFTTFQVNLNYAAVLLTFCIGVTCVFVKNMTHTDVEDHYVYYQPHT
jgi:hypothetical protein